MDFALSNDTGLSDYLIGEQELDGIIQTTDVQSLDLISSGPVPPNPLELLINQSILDWLDELKARCHYMVLDSLPEGLVADSLELMRHIDLNLFVARQNFTNKQLLQYVEDQYERRVIQKTYLLLNDLGNPAGYGYGYGHYEEDDQPNRTKKKRRK